MAEWHIGSSPTLMDHPLQGLVSWIYDDVGKSICVVESDEDTMNARLIAAAPDLLAACQALIAVDEADYSGIDHGYTAPSNQARAAIAKATGKD